MAGKTDVFDPKWDALATDGPRRAILDRMRERRDTFAAVSHAAGLNGTYLGQFFKKPSPRVLPLPVARRIAEVLDLPIGRLFAEGPVPESGAGTAPVAGSGGKSNGMSVVSHMVFPDGEVIEIRSNRRITAATVERLEAAVAMLKAGR